MGGNKCSVPSFKVDGRRKRTTSPPADMGGTRRPNKALLKPNAGPRKCKSLYFNYFIFPRGTRCFFGLFPSRTRTRSVFLCFANTRGVCVFTRTAYILPKASARLT